MKKSREIAFGGVFLTTASVCTACFLMNFQNDWIMLVHRPKSASYDWWKKAGGFDISYPSYKCYENLSKMKDEIAAQNAAILQFSSEVEAQWSPFTPDWVLNTFGQKLDFQFPGSDDISVTVIK